MASPATANNKDTRNIKEDDDESLLHSILSSGGDDGEETNYFECLGGLPLRLHAPSEIRKTFLKLSRKVHPDKNSHALAKEAFQVLSTAFETLYDEQSQRNHLQEVLVRKQTKLHEKKKTTAASGDSNKKRKQQQRSDHDWKQQQREAKKKKAEEAEAAASSTPAWKRWEDFVADMKRRERLEREFFRFQSDARLEKKIKGLTWKAMKICRNLDERAGCPSTFVNGLWAPLYEQEVLRQPEAKLLPEGWQRLYLKDEGITLYRNLRTGQESPNHPNPKIQALLEKARTAERTNNYRFQTQTRQFLQEIIDYLHEDHEYLDMDDDMKELEEEEQGANDNNTNNNNNQGTQEYDY